MSDTTINLLAILGVGLSILGLFIPHVISQTRRDTRLSLSLDKAEQHISESDAHAEACAMYQSGMTVKTEQFSKDITAIAAMGTQIIASQTQHQVMSEYMEKIIARLEAVINDNTAALNNLAQTRNNS